MLHYIPPVTLYPAATLYPDFYIISRLVPVVSDPAGRDDGILKELEANLPAQVVGDLSLRSSIVYLYNNIM